MASRKYRLVRPVQKYLLNPLPRLLLRTTGFPPTHALLETTGRRSGKPRRTPVGNGLQGDTFWLVTEHGRPAQYVRNIEANPRVRVKVGRRWYGGTAHVLPDDDPRARQRTLSRANAAVVRAVGSELLTVRIDLDDADSGR